MLRDLDHLRAFLDGIYANAPLPISVKTRLGYESPEEFPALLEIFNDYPIHELTVHPRVRKDFYKGGVNMDAFRYCLAHSKAPVCYNGNLCSLSQIEAFQKEFPQVEAVMIGRGLVGDPGMLTPGGTTAEALECFMEELLERYRVVFGSERNAMFRLKENWHMLLCRFENSEKLGKRLRKTTDLEEYRAISQEIFHTLPLAPELQADW
jgi:tRNA-dihydrouridine synthase